MAFNLHTLLLGLDYAPRPIVTWDEVAALSVKKWTRAHRIDLDSGQRITTIARYNPAKKATELRVLRFFKYIR